MPSGTFPDCCCQSRTHGEALLTHTSTGHPPTLAGSLVQPLWGYCSFPLSLGARKVLFVPPKTSFCLPLASHSCGNLVIKSRWPSRWDSLGIPSPFVRSPGWEAWRGFPNLPNSGGGGFSVIIVLQIVGHPPSGYGVWFYDDCDPPDISLQLFLCVWMWDIFFWWVPVFSCRWLFNS